MMADERKLSEVCSEEDSEIIFYYQKWKVLEEIGRGTFGHVHKARNLENNKLVALKYIFMKETKLVDCVANEIKCLQQLSHHSNIVRLRGYNCNLSLNNSDSNKRGVVLMFEYMPHGTLFDLLYYSHSNFDESIARTYFKQLMKGLHACHRLNIIHRDIKLQNLLLDSSFQLKIADFGSAVQYQCKRNSSNHNDNEIELNHIEYGHKSANQSKNNENRDMDSSDNNNSENNSDDSKNSVTNLNNSNNSNNNSDRASNMDDNEESMYASYRVGTKGYQAPEMLENKKYTKSIDIFSSGVVLFIMIAGYLPFEDGKKTDIPYKYIANEKYPQFWQWHQKNYGFKCKKVKLAIDLITRMIVYDDKKRIKLGLIRRHPWYKNGTTLNKRELESKMNILYQKCTKNKFDNDN